MERLQARRVDVVNWVQRDEDAGLQRLDGVKVWLKDVETIENQADTIERKMACTSEHQLCSICKVRSKKLASRFRYGKEVFSMLEDVKELMTTGKFKTVAAPAMREVVEERYLQQIIVDQNRILESAWNHLMDDGTRMMGLYGMGGVGKTTLLEQINNKFKGANDDGFEKVIWVVVSNNLLIEKIQDEIAEKLGFITGDDSWKQKEKIQKAIDIHTRLKNKKFVLLLDDIWEEVALKEIGVPFPTRENGCKVAFTTRSRQVCGQMGVDDPIEVKCLDTDQAWDLFRSKVGRNTLESHPDILERARQVARKCRGLPLALNIIGKNMASKRTVQEWDDAINTLASYAAKFPGMKDHIFPILLYSYDGLREDEPVKSCFQYCALFPEDDLIEKDLLADYWIGEEFIDEKQGLRKAKNKAHGIIGTLVQACLLTEEGRDKSLVKMHDVVREMALWIANDFGKDKERCIVQAGVGLREVPTVENWTSVRRMSLMRNEIKRISDTPMCPELTTLLFQKNDMKNISGGFFKSMPNLVVLDLSNNRFIINGLAEEISELVSLRYLDLSSTGIKRLTGCLLKLIKLIYLNLEETSELESISGISNLSCLRTLGLKGSKSLIDLGLVKELELLQHLEALTIKISSSSVAEQLLRSPRLVKCIEYVGFKDLEEESFGVMTLPTMVNFRRLDIIGCGMREIQIGGTASSSWNNMPTETCFQNLSSITITDCDGLKDLTWLLFAQNLTDLEVGRLKQLEEIISEEKAVNSVVVPFRKLNSLTLYMSPMLKSIYWSPLPFPDLKEIAVTYCPELRKLPLDSKSVGRVEELEIYWIPLDFFPKGICKTYAPLDWIYSLSIGETPGECVIDDEDKGWLEEVEWEDEATRLRFIPTCTLRPY